MLSAKDLGNGKQFQNALQTTTIRSFDGGWNVVDADLNMKPKFSTVLDNMERGLDGTLELRPGTIMLCDIGNGVAIVNCTYFNDQTIVVQSNGWVWTVDNAGNPTKMQIAAVDPWDIAAGGVKTVSFTIFNGDLILVDNIHKPLIISGHPYDAVGAANALYNTLQYLIDIPSTFNINTPVAKYIASHGQFCVMANLAAEAGKPPRPSSISISAKGTSGTYVGDPAPNDAVEIDLGVRVSLGDRAITGIVSYRDKLLVAFERGVILLTLDVYVGTPTAVHTPTDDGFIEEFGCIAGRSMISVGDDTYYLDNIGVNSIARVSVFNTLRPEKASALIDPAITELVQAASIAQIDASVFAVYDMRHRRYMLFVPILNVSSVVTETVCFSYTNVPTQKIEAWARLRGWNWTAACRTTLQDIIFATSDKLFVYDFAGRDAGRNRDFVDDPDVDPATLLGVPITFDWQLPWADFTKRMNSKHTSYISMDTVGTGIFTLSMYVDNILVDRNSDDAPALSAVMQGGSNGGYGGQYYGPTYYGGGVPTADERLFAWPAKFKIAKLRVHGVTDKPLRIVSISMSYTSGSIRR